MTETKDARSGSERLTRAGSSSVIRRFAFAGIVAGGALLLFWIQRNTWRQLARLEADYALVSSQSFYLGVNLRSTIRSMNSAALDSVLRPGGPGWNEFLRESAELRGFLVTNRAQLARLSELDLLRREQIERQTELLRRVETATADYVAGMERQFRPTRSGNVEPDFDDAYRAVRDGSAGLLTLCSELVAGQRGVLGEFLDGTQKTLADHQRLLKLSSALTIVLAIVLALVVYRGMIAPLHAQLSESQAVIERQEKLASLGVLAAGVAHEIRNPLTAIKFRLFSLRRSLPPEWAGDEDLGVISGELTRLERIVRDFLQFARPSDPELVPAAVARIAEEVCDLLGAELRRSGVRLSLEPGPPAWVRADPQQLKQVLINLVRNAAESIEGEGRVTLRVRRATTALRGPEEPVVVLGVEDDGRGIAPDIERRLFDPFFSTREGGTGLGLPIAARIVDKHGGTLRYQTQPGRGTTFEIVLPAIDPHVTETPDHRG